MFMTSLQSNNFLYSAVPLFVWLHELVGLDLLCKPLNMRTMRPRLLSNLLPHRTRKTSRPLHPRPPCHNLVNSALTHKVWVLPRIIQQRRQQNQCSNSRNCASLPEVLVTDYRLGYGLGLRFWCAEELEEG